MLQYNDLCKGIFSKYYTWSNYFSILYFIIGSQLLKKDSDIIRKDSVILARQKRNVDSNWSRGNIKQMWIPAIVLKVRSSSTEGKLDTYDVSLTYVYLNIIICVLISLLLYGYRF